MQIPAACIGVSAQCVEGGVGEEFEPLFDGEASVARGDRGEEPGIDGLEVGVLLEWLIDGGHVGWLVIEGAVFNDC